MDNKNKATDWLETRFYQIRLQGYLDLDWSEWFDGLSITHGQNGETLLSGFIPDQAALFSVFHKIQNLGIPLLSVTNTRPQS